MRSVGSRTPVSWACGFTSGDTAVTLIGRADEALYAAKAQGCNRVAVARVELPGGVQFA